jgi:hypothetical protein
VRKAESEMKPEKASGVRETDYPPFVKRFRTAPSTWRQDSSFHECNKSGAAHDKREKLSLFVRPFIQICAILVSQLKEVAQWISNRN